MGVAPNTRSLGNVNQVYVLKQGTSCEHLRWRLRAVGGIYVLDSKLGTVRLQGKKGASTPGLARRLHQPHPRHQDLPDAEAGYRAEAGDDLPGRQVPDRWRDDGEPPTGADGEGIYPHSYERLGAQRGWHISVVLLDPSPASTTPGT